MADKLRDQQELEALQAKFIGTGFADTTSGEWRENVARDTLSSIVGHPPMLQYVAIGSGECRERSRIALIERMVWPYKAPMPKKVADVKKYKIPADSERAVPASKPKVADTFIIVKMDETEAEMESEAEK